MNTASSATSPPPRLDCRTDQREPTLSQLRGEDLNLLFQDQNLAGYRLPHPGSQQPV
jgi:hypothetical protein